MVDEEQVMTPVTHKYTVVDEEQVMARSSRAVLPWTVERQETQVSFSMHSAPVNNKQCDAIQSASAPNRNVNDVSVESGYQSNTQDLDHFSQQALKRKSSSMSSSSSDASASDRSPVPKKSKIVVLKTKGVGTGTAKSNTELKDQEIELLKKKVTILEKQLEIKSTELNESRDCAKRWETKHRDLIKEYRELRKEREEFTAQNSKLRIENNKLKSTAGKTVLTILEEEVKGQLDGMRNQWAKLGTPPKTADHGVDASVQTEDDSTSKKQAELTGDLDNVIAAAMINFQFLEAAREHADGEQRGLKVRMLKAVELMKKLNEKE
jgi:hypothetical protein